MSKKKAVWISALIGAAETAAVATVTYFAPPNAVAINIAIAAFCDAAIIAVNAFVKEAAK